ncbi:MAG: BamA/TamA family outer membrane protein [Lentimicrobiaceae bacterium]
MKKRRNHITFLILIMISLAACHPARKVERRGGYLLVKNTIKKHNSYLPSDELEGFIQQNAMQGRLAPYFRPGIFFYENSLKGHETKFKLFQRNSLGKKPVILDTLMVLSTADKLGLYLKNKGFYHATVNKSIKYSRKTASVTYDIISGPPCIVNNFSYIIADSVIQGYIMADTSNGKLRKGMIYDTYVLDDARDKIANMLRNNSYFNFSLSDIYYQVDTSNAGLSAEVEMYIKNIRMSIPGTTDSTREIQHPRFYIKNIYITTNASNTSQASSFDTLSYKYYLNKSDTTGRTLFILHDQKLSLKPSFLSSCMEFATGDAYSQSKANLTYKKLISQPIIGSANVSMSIRNPEMINPAEKQWLDCNIRLIRNKLNTFSLGTEGTNSGGRFGVGLNTSVQNRNLFRGAEVLSLKVRASAELQGSLNNQNTNSTNYFLFFNTLEAGMEASIDFPRLLLPYPSSFKQQLKNGRTSLSAGAGIEFRPEYKRRITTSAWSYKWNKDERIRNIFTPVELNYIKIFPSESFSLYLDTLTDPQYKSQFTDHLLTMIRYSFIYSNTGITKQNNQFFFRLNTETSGNIPYFIDKIDNKQPVTDGTGNAYFERFGVRYSQYARLDVDYRKYWKLRFNNLLVFRLMGGIAMPYGNSVAIPFEKSFWLGGANDMRGWRLRSLGPGAFYSSVTRYDKTGDIMLQSSLEQRFPIYSFLLGSLFLDAGNVWLRKKSDDFPDGEFNLNSFYKQIAMDIGFGLRFDFSFFIFRVDAAVPFHNPAVADKWFSREEFKLRNSILNFGIGYPF